MEKELITNKQGIMMTILFVLGSNLLLGIAEEAKRDSWIAALLSIIMAVPALLAYSRILSNFPGKNLFEILQMVFGRFFGGVISILYIWYAFHLGSLVVRNFSEFINVIALPETPELFIVVVFMLLCIWAVKDGIELLGKWSEFFTHLVIFFIIALVLLSIPNMELNNILPIMYNGPKPVIKGAISGFAFPFAETVIFTMVFGALKDKSSPYRILLTGMLVGGVILTIVALMNILVLGEKFMSILYFSTYSSIRTVNVGGFIQRVEGSVAISFMIAGFVKVCVCLLAACKGLAKVLKIESYRVIVTPVALLMAEVAYVNYISITVMIDWNYRVYNIYALPFQVLLPIIILIGSEIKIRRSKKA